MTSMIPGVEAADVNAPPGFVGSGSTSPPLRRQPSVLALVNAGSVASSEKSPVRCNGVGTSWLCTLSVMRRFKSSDPNKKKLYFFWDPPTEIPKLLRRNVYFYAVGQ